MSKNRALNIPDRSESYWLDSVEFPTFPSLEENCETDVVIIGGGFRAL